MQDLPQWCVGCDNVSVRPESAWVSLVMVRPVVRAIASRSRLLTASLAIRSTSSARSLGVSRGEGERRDNGSRYRELGHAYNGALVDSAAPGPLFQSWHAFSIMLSL